MHSLHLDGDDFEVVWRHATIIHTHTGPGGVLIHVAEYLGRDVFLIQHPAHEGGTVIEKTQPGEVGNHEMVRDALMHGLIELPQQRASQPAELVQSPARHLALDDVPQDVVAALNRVHYVSDGVWADELMRTSVIQTDEPAGHAIAHMGIRDDGQPIVLVQCDSLFIIFLPMQEP